VTAHQIDLTLLLLNPYQIWACLRGILGLIQVLVWCLPGGGWGGGCLRQKLPAVQPSCSSNS